MNEKTNTIKSKLLPYQTPHVDAIMYSVSKYNRVLDGSDTGTGKTYTSIASSMLLGLKPLIICPKSVISSWMKVLDTFECEYYGVANYESIQNCKMFTRESKYNKVPCPYIKRSVVVDKEKELMPDNSKKIKIPKKQKLKLKAAPVMEKPKKEEVEYTYNWQNLPKDIIIIFDEAHRCKNPRTLNSVLLYTLAKHAVKIIMLSATVSDKPENFALCGYVLGLYKNMRDANKWIETVGKNYDNVMTGVNNAIFPEYAARMRITNLGKLFPDNQIVASCYDMEESEEIEKQYKLIEAEVEKLKNKEENSGCVLAAILYARMKIETLKIPTYIEQAKKYLEEHNAVAIFVNFTQTLKTIADELGTSCVIHGQQTLEERAKAIDDFNSDRSHIIVANISSGGVGISLQDLHGNFPRVSIISPGYSAQTIVQALGRIHRAGGRTSVRQRLIFCKATLEEKICENLKDKIQNICMLNDGDLMSIHIEGLTDDQDSIGIKDDNLSEFDRLFMKINVLNIRKQRLQEDIKDIDDEVKMLEEIMHSMIITY